MELNGRIQQDKHPLTVAISDPSKRKSRSDDFVNGCEVFVRELGKRMSENELVQLFEPVGVLSYFRIFILHYDSLELLRTPKWD